VFEPLNGGGGGGGGGTEYVGCKVLIAVAMKSTIFRDATLCSRVHIHQCFRGVYRLHLQGEN
jgi:hypothetical protein